jgi:hypothetical protein
MFVKYLTLIFIFLPFINGQNENITITDTDIVPQNDTRADCQDVATDGTYGAGHKRLYTEKGLIVKEYCNRDPNYLYYFWRPGNKGEGNYFLSIYNNELRWSLVKDFEGTCKKDKYGGKLIAIYFTGESYGKYNIGFFPYDSINTGRYLESTMGGTVIIGSSPWTKWKPIQYDKSTLFEVNFGCMSGGAIIQSTGILGMKTDTLHHVCHTSCDWYSNVECDTGQYIYIDRISDFDRNNPDLCGN